MVPPICRLLVAPILQVSAITIRLAIDHDHWDPAMWLLSMKLSNALLYCLIFYVKRLSVPGDKRRVFEMIACAFLLGRCIETTRTDPSYSPIFFLPQPPKSALYFGVILDLGGTALSPPWYFTIEVGCALFLQVACINNSKCLGENIYCKNYCHCYFIPLITSQAVDNNCFWA
jgi:hypothetical protein